MGTFQGNLKGLKESLAPRLESAKQGLSTLRRKVGEVASNAKARIGKITDQHLESMTPEQRQAWAKRHQQVVNLNNKVTEKANELSENLRAQVTSATQKVKEFGRVANNTTSNDVSTAALTASHDVAKAAVRRIEQICSNYQKKPRPGSVAATLGGKTRRRKRNKQSVKQK
jgi:hypothetical protein